MKPIDPFPSYDATVGVAIGDTERERWQMENRAAIEA